MPLPSPTALTGTTAYFRGTTTAVFFWPTCANPAAPTLAEVNAGKNITGQIMAISGFALSTASLDLALAGAGFTGSVPGRTSAGDSNITFELASNGPANDIRTYLTANLLGYLGFANEGVVTGGTFDVWPIRVGSYSPDQDLEAIGQVVVPVFPYIKPSLNIALPVA